jgi:hypothetical protein
MTDTIRRRIFFLDNGSIYGTIRIIILFKKKNARIMSEIKGKKFSGQFRLRIPGSLHGALAEEAHSQGVSLNSYIIFLLSSRHSQEQTWQRALQFHRQQVEDTAQAVQEMHKMVVSLTLGEPEQEGFTWISTETSNVVIQ